MPATGGRHGRGSRPSVRNEPLGGRFGFFPIAPRIAERRWIGMQNALANVEVTTSNPEHILMFGVLVMHTHFVGA